MSEAISKKPKAITMEKEINLLMINFNQPFLGFGFTFQILFMESCISTNKVVEERINVTIPIVIPILDLFSKVIF